MDHIAILNKIWKLLPKIISGQKTIESRWYKVRTAPWDRIQAGDVVYFKDSGEPVTIRAEVEKALQYEDLTEQKIREILDEYGDRIALSHEGYSKYYDDRRYCILIFLKNVQELDHPIQIDKTGYGNAAAWMCVGDIESVSAT